MTAHRYFPSGTPRLNHVALCLDAGLLDAGGRAELRAFWGEVFGFEELEVMTEDGRRLVLSCVHWDQFLFLIADDDPMRCPRLDHFGIAVDRWPNSRGSGTGRSPIGSGTTGWT